MCHSAAVHPQLAGVNNTLLTTETNSSDMTPDSDKNECCEKCKYFVICKSNAMICKALNP